MKELERSIKKTERRLLSKKAELVGLLKNLSETLHRAAIELEERNINEDYLGINQLGIVQSRGQRIDLLCGVVNEKHEAYLELKDIKLQLEEKENSQKDVIESSTETP